MQQLFTDGSETGAEITGNVVPVRGGWIWFRFAKARDGEPGENERNKIDGEKKKKGFKDTNYMLPVEITKEN